MRRRPKGVILSGGPASVYEEGAPALDRRLLELGVPVLGICYGMQLLALALGGRIEGAEVGEFGRSQLTVSRQAAGCWPARRASRPAGCPTATRCSRRRPGSARWPRPRPRRWRRSSRSSAGVYGIQFHPEVVHTPYGQQVLTNFLADVCGCERTWSPTSVIEDQIEAIRAQVGDGPGDLRPVGRGRLERGGAARAPRDRRPADLRVRRPRTDAQGRGRSGDHERSATTSTCRWSRSTPPIGSWRG